MSLDFDYAAARTAGYSDDDILSGLQKRGELDFDLGAARRAGYSSSDILKSIVGDAPKQEEQSSLRRLGDVGLSLVKGAIGVPEAAVGLADIVTGGYAGKAAEWAGFRPREAREFLDELLSDKQKAANREVSDAEGFVGTAGAMLQNPSTIGHAAVEALPSMAAGGLIGRGIGAAGKLSPYVAGAIGEGVIGAGTAAERTRQQTEDGTLTAGQSAAAVGSGTMTALLGAVGGRVAQKLGVSDIDTVLAAGPAGITSKGIARRMVEGGIAEGVFEEMPQSIQEQVWQNAALDRPLMEGVPESAAAGMLTGTAMGGAVGGAISGQPAAPQELQADPLLIENKPDPLISFPDGTVGRQADVDAYIAGLPEADQLPARARLLGIGEPAAKPEVADIQSAETIDDAIMAAVAVVDAPTEIDTELKNQQIDQAFAAHMAGIRQQEFDLAEQARRDADFQAAESQARDQAVDQANIITEAQGFDTQEPTAMQLAMQEAQARRELYMTPVSQRAEIEAPAPASQAAEAIQQVQEVPNVESPAVAAPVRDDGIGSAGNIAQEQPSAAQGLAPLQSPVEVRRDDIAAEALPSGRTGVSGADSAMEAPAALSTKEDVSALVAQAKSVLNQAKVTGKDRLDLLDRVRSGSLSVEDLAEAYPQEAPPATVPPSAADVTPVAPKAKPVALPLSAPVERPEPAREVEMPVFDESRSKQRAQAGWQGKVQRKEEALAAQIATANENAAKRKLPLKSESAASSGITAAEVVKSITPMRAKWLGFTKVNTVQSVADLPPDVAERAKADEKTEAVYDPQTKSVHLIADNIKSPARAAWVAVHEVVGHGGLRMLKDKSVNEALNLAGANRFVRDLAQAIRKDRGDASEQVATEEAIAELAAAIETENYDAISDRYGIDVPAASRNGLRGTLARVFETIKRFLASVMGKPVADVSDAEVRGLIDQQRAAVESEPEAETETEADPSPEADAEPVLQSRAQTVSWNVPDIKWQDNVVRVMQDKMVDLKKVVAAIRENVGTIADKWNPYLQEELFHGRSAKRVTDFQESELRPLVQEMQMRKVEIPEFEEYLHNRHAEERNNQIAKVNDEMPDGGSGIDTADARKYLNGLTQAKRKNFESLAKRIDAINKRTRQELAASGLETPETIAAWEAAYQYYVPLQREESGAGIGQGFSVRGSSSKRATGSRREVINVLANLMMQRERAIVRIEKNRVATALLGLVKEAPNPDFWKADVAPTERIVETRGGKDQVVEREIPGFRNRENVVSVRLNGEDHFVIFNEDNERAISMAKAIKNLDADQLGRVLSMSAKVTRYFAAINTQYNPIFGGINLIRDTQGALLNLSTTQIAGKQKAVLAHTASALRGIYIDLRDHRAGKAPTSAWANLYEEFQNEGGQTGFRDMFATSESRTNAIKNELNPDAWMDSRFGKLFTANGTLKVPLSVATKSASGVFNWLSDYNTAMENAVRLSAYKVGKEQGMTNQQAASMAKNLTVNFNRKGQVATQAGALYAFFNASVQGTSRLYETMTGPMGKKILMGGLLLGSMQALVLAAAGFDEDEPPEHLRSRNIIIPIGDGKYTSIPMPLGFNLIPSLSRLTTEFALEGFRNPTKKIASMIDMIFGTFNPIGNAGLSLQTIAPTAIDPLAALSENRDFTGKKISKEDMNGLAPTPGHMRAKDTASEISKALSYWFNIASGGTKYTPGMVSPTPDQLDYLIGQVTGGVGREALKTEQTVTSTFSGEDLPPHKVPILGRFYGDTKGNSGISAKFYDNIKDLNAHELEIKGRRADGGDVVGYMRENRDAMLVPLANRIERDVQKLREVKRELLEKDADRERIKKIEEQISNRMKQLNDRVIALREKRAT